MPQKKRKTREARKLRKGERKKRRMRRGREEEEEDKGTARRQTIQWETVPKLVPVWDPDREQWVNEASPPIFERSPERYADLEDSEGREITALKVALLDFLYADCIDPANEGKGAPLGVALALPSAVVESGQVFFVQQPSVVAKSAQKSERHVRLTAFNDATGEIVRSTLSDTFQGHPVLKEIGTTPGRHWFLAVRECWMWEKTTRFWWEYAVKRPSLRGLRFHADPVQDRIIAIWMHRACKRLQASLFHPGPADDAWAEFIFQGDVMARRLSTAPRGVERTCSLFRLTFLEEPDDTATMVALDQDAYSDYQRYYRRMKCYEGRNAETGNIEIEFQIDPFNSDPSSGYVITGGPHRRKRYFDPSDPIDRPAWLNAMKSFYTVAFNMSVCRFLLQLFEANRERYHYLWDEPAP